MSNGENGKSGPQFRSGPLIVSAVLVGAGTLIALTGLAVGGGYVASLTRQWAQARAAVSAGTSAWQNGTQANVPSES